MFKLMGKKIITILRLFVLSKPMEGEGKRRCEREREKREREIEEIERRRERGNAQLYNIVHLEI